MEEIIVYLIKVILIQGLLFGFYYFLLRSKTTHALNRAYLILVLVLSLVVPFVGNILPSGVDDVSEFVVVAWVAEPIGEIEIVAMDAVQRSLSVPVWDAISWIYLTLVALLLGRSAFHIYVLQKLKKRSEYVKKPWFKLFKTAHAMPFSFFSDVFIPRTVFGTGSFDAILSHECEHVRKWHSMDRLFIDLLAALFWFNPFIYLYRNALIEVHEYQADAYALKKYGDPVGYQEILFAQLQPSYYSGLASHFNFSTLKKRIVMMNKEKNTGRSQLVYLSTVPLIIMILFAFNSKEAEWSLAEITDQIEEFTGPFEVAESGLAPIPQEDRFIPSILPIDATKARFTSGFGKRIHPVKKIRNYHSGMDFSAPIGTDIYATADGEVISVISQKGGYGLHIEISHGDEFKTKYAQLSEFKVKKGQKVKRGQVIALSGNSGMSTGPHLHYEVRKNDEAVDPIDFIKDVKLQKLGKKVEKVSEEEEELMKAEKLARMKAEEKRMAAERMETEAKSMREVDKELLKAAERARMEAEEVVIKARKDIEVEEQAVLSEIHMEDSEVVRVEAEKIIIRRGREEGEPLFVVDGVVMENGGIYEISHEEIAHIQVIKDDKAIEKYGDRGRYGVIEIYSIGKDKSKDKNKLKKKKD